MKEENEKRTWETPEIIDLDLERTRAGLQSTTYESGVTYHPTS